MAGFELYITNTSTIPPNGYRCYKDPGPGLPSIIQTIPCNHLGKYVIYYDTTGSIHDNVRFAPIVELCYVALNGEFNVYKHEKLHLPRTSLSSFNFWC